MSEAEGLTTIKFGGGPEVPVNLAAVAGHLRAAAEKKFGPDRSAPGIVQMTTDGRLKSIIDRIVRLSEEKAALASDISDICREAKASGYNLKAIRIVVKHQMESSEERDAREAAESEVDRMKAALGMLADTPLGQAARGA